MTFDDNLADILGIFVGHQHAQIVGQEAVQKLLAGAAQARTARGKHHFAVEYDGAGIIHLCAGNIGGAQRGEQILDDLGAHAYQLVELCLLCIEHILLLLLLKLRRVQTELCLLKGGLLLSKLTLQTGNLVFLGGKLRLLLIKLRLLQQKLSLLSGKLALLLIELRSLRIERCFLLLKLRTLRVERCLLLSKLQALQGELLFLFLDREGLRYNRETVEIWFREEGDRLFKKGIFMVLFFFLIEGTEIR